MLVTPQLTLQPCSSRHSHARHGHVDGCTGPCHGLTEVRQGYVGSRHGCRHFVTLVLILIKVVVKFVTQVLVLVTVVVTFVKLFWITPCLRE